MKSILLFWAILLFPVTVMLGQGSSPTSKQATSNTDIGQEKIAVTGCLRKNSLNEYEITDEEGGTQYLPYGSTVNLDSYLGHEVTLVGVPGAMPTSDTSAHSSPHLKVSKVQSAGAKCSMP